MKFQILRKNDLCVVLSLLSVNAVVRGIELESVASVILSEKRRKKDKRLNTTTYVEGMVRL